ncbi:MAG: MCE family protein [Saprospiraceae bacterium]|nr:MCE family protein [Saprospiraceae bacterium]
MSKETKLGIFAFLVIAGAIWGYNYLKGSNLLARTQVFSAHYENIGDLMVSSPVKINGFQVGSVTRVYLEETNMQSIIAEFTVRNDISIPTTTTAVIVPGGIMGGAAIDRILPACVPVRIVRKAVLYWKAASWASFSRCWVIRRSIGTWPGSRKA